jgi:hypothetical protein
MTSQPDALLAIEPAHLPQYSHSAVIIGSVIILAIITLVAGVALVIAHHLVSPGRTTPRDHSLRLQCVEKHETYAQVAQDGWEKHDVTALVAYSRRSA